MRFAEYLLAIAPDALIFPASRKNDATVVRFAGESAQLVPITQSIKSLDGIRIWLVVLKYVAGLILNRLDWVVRLSYVVYVCFNHFLEQAFRKELMSFNDFKIYLELFSILLAILVLILQTYCFSRDFNL